uniref:Si:ch73-335l21.2 n=1 Tax=Gadus morhua TaxID=8049 RepID=A0A8C5FWL0_GADMO
ILQMSYSYRLEGELATPASGTDPLEAECPVCYQEYNRYTKCPRMLECLHVFCGECLQRIQLCPCDAHGLPAIPCPLCRHLTPLLSGDTLCLPPNLRILARLPPAAYSLPSSLQAAPRLHASVTQRVYSLNNLRGLRSMKWELIGICGCGWL